MIAARTHRAEALLAGDPVTSLDAYMPGVARGRHRCRAIDLLGFPLPDAARVDHEWWANNDPNDIPPPHSRSWTLASRKATPNLPAQTVVFERAQH